jgi:coniferyl-aldehyde dehydrogenase
MATTVEAPAAQHLETLLRAQRAAFQADPTPSVAVRRLRIDRLRAAVLSDARVDEVGEDVGQRPATASLAADILGPMGDVCHIRRKLAAWSTPRRVRPGLHTLIGTRVRGEPRPLGVVVIIAPWNFPSRSPCSPGSRRSPPATGS